jgi:hypothetical protein
MKQQQGAIEKEKEREEDAGRARIAARKRFSNKRRSLMRAAITAKAGETKAKAAQHVRPNPRHKSLSLIYVIVG